LLRTGAILQDEPISLLDLPARLQPLDSALSLRRALLPQLALRRLPELFGDKTTVTSTARSGNACAHRQCATNTTEKREKGSA